MLWAASSKASAAVSLVTDSVVMSTVSKDSCVTRLTADSIATDSTDRAKKRKPFYEKGLLGKAVNYLRNSNKTAQDSKRDFGFIPGPHYSSTTASTAWTCAFTLLGECFLPHATAPHIIAKATKL